MNNKSEGFLWFVLEPNLMPAVLAPYLGLFDLLWLAAVSSRIRRAWLTSSSSRATREKWQRALRIRERVEARFGWQCADDGNGWGRWSNVLLETLKRISYAHVFPREPGDVSRMWWCMAGGGGGTCKGAIVSAKRLVAKALSPWRSCIDCFTKRHGGNVVVGDLYIQSLHFATHGRRAPLMTYTPENNPYMFCIYHFGAETHGRCSRYAILYKHILACGAHI